MGEKKRRRGAELEDKGAKVSRGKIGRGSRLTWRVILLFLLGMVVLDIVLFAVFQFGLDSCYGALCLF